MLPNKRQCCSVYDLKPGMRIGQEIFAPNHRTLLVEGTRLTAKQIRRLTVMDIDTVTILAGEDELNARGMPGSLPNRYSELVFAIEKAFNHVKLFNEVPLADMQELVAYSLHPVVETAGILSYLHLLQRKDQYTLQHSVNVAIISGILGKWLGYRGVELLDLILAGLLHDFGKIFIRDDILNKPGKLTKDEFDIIKGHSTEGYLLLESADIPLRVRHGILQHHERHDGSGYPLGLREEAISDYARIIAVADIFDAMTSDRCYQKKRTPLSAAEAIAEQMFRQLEPYICITFLNNVRNSFVGTTIQLSDGRSAEIVCFRTQISRPIVKTDDGVIIDLSQNSQLKLVEV